MQPTSRDNHLPAVFAADKSPMYGYGATLAIFVCCCGFADDFLLAGI